MKEYNINQTYLIERAIDKNVITKKDMFNIVPNIESWYLVNPEQLDKIKEDNKPYIIFSGLWVGKINNKI